MPLSLKFFNLQSQVEHLNSRVYIYAIRRFREFFILYFVYLIINRIKCSNVPHTQKASVFKGLARNI